MNRLFLLLTIVKKASVTFGSAADKFLGSPLLILVVLIAVSAIAFAFHRFRK